MTYCGYLSGVCNYYLAPSLASTHHWLWTPDRISSSSHTLEQAGGWAWGSSAVVTQQTSDRHRAALLWCEWMRSDVSQESRFLRYIHTGSYGESSHNMIAWLDVAPINSNCCIAVNVGQLSINLSQKPAAVFTLKVRIPAWPFSARIVASWVI